MRAFEISSGELKVFELGKRFPETNIAQSGLASPTIINSIIYTLSCVISLAQQSILRRRARGDPDMSYIDITVRCERDSPSDVRGDGVCAALVFQS